MKSAVTVSLVAEAKGGPFVYSSGLADACQKAAALGFDGIEVFPPDAAGLEVAALRSELERFGLKLAAVGTGGGWVRHKLTLTDSDPAIRQAARAFVRDIIAAAGELGAPAIIGSMQGRCAGGITREQACAYFAEALEELDGEAAKRGVTLLYEPLNRYETNLFNGLRDAAAWLHTLRTPHVRLLADLFHMNIEEADSAAALRDVGPRVGHVHFADSNRRAIGFGQTAVGPIIAALRDIGYAGYLSAEVFPLPDSDAAARQTIEAYRRHAG